MKKLVKIFFNSLHFGQIFFLKIHLGTKYCSRNKGISIKNIWDIYKNSLKHAFYYSKHFGANSFLWKNFWTKNIKKFWNKKFTVENFKSYFFKITFGTYILRKTFINTNSEQFFLLIKFAEF